MKSLMCADLNVKRFEDRTEFAQDLAADQLGRRGWDVVDRSLADLVIARAIAEA